ncbi:hypothetical protein Scep_029534 [Stephania cephalantha]|uniref:Uncharacterized protein n=1 Tax=Stephania cephalantha TaxID=152367 RepID=A0AAP0E5K7_9MAGN
MNLRDLKTNDGQTEDVNQCLEEYFGCVTADSPSIWSKFVPGLNSVLTLQAPSDASWENLDEF